MAAPNPVPSTNTVYNDGNIAFGSFIATIFDGPQPNGTQRGIYIVESATPVRATKKVLRSDEIGGPNGFVLITAQNTMSGVIQGGDASVQYPQVGDWFTLTLDGVLGSERWVIESISVPYTQDGYRKWNFSASKATFPTVTPTSTPA